MTLLGAIGLESLNLRVDLGRKELVPTGPVPAAVIGRAWRAALFASAAPALLPSIYKCARSGSERIRHDAIRAEIREDIVS